MRNISISNLKNFLSSENLIFLWISLGLIFLQQMSLGQILLFWDTYHWKYAMNFFVINLKCFDRSGDPYISDRSVDPYISDFSIILKYPRIFVVFFEKIKIIPKYFLTYRKNKNILKLFSRFLKKYFSENNIFSTSNRENIFFYIFSGKMKKYFWNIFSMRYLRPSPDEDLTVVHAQKILRNYEKITTK